MSENAASGGRIRLAHRARPVRRAALVALLVGLGLGGVGCSAQQEVVRMPELTGLPIKPLPLPPPVTVMSISQKDAAIAQMQAAARKNTSLAD